MSYQPNKLLHASNHQYYIYYECNNHRNQQKLTENKLIEQYKYRGSLESLSRDYSHVSRDQYFIYNQPLANWKLAPYPTQFSHLLSTYSQIAARILLPEFEPSSSTWFCHFICTSSFLAVHLVLDYNRHGKITLYTIRRPWGLLVLAAVTNLHRKILMGKGANTAPKKWWTSTPLPDHTS